MTLTDELAPCGLSEEGEAIQLSILGYVTKASSIVTYDQARLPFRSPGLLLRGLFWHFDRLSVVDFEAVRKSKEKSDSIARELHQTVDSPRASLGLANRLVLVIAIYSRAESIARSRRAPTWVQL